MKRFFHFMIECSVCRTFPASNIPILQKKSKILKYERRYGFAISAICRPCQRGSRCPDSRAKLESKEPILRELEWIKGMISDGTIQPPQMIHVLDKIERKKIFLSESIEGTLQSLMRLNASHNLASSMLSECTETYSKYLWESYEERRKRANYVISKTELRLIVFGRDGNRCLHCKSSEGLSVDHIIPVSKGGSNDLSNLQTLCKPCNSKKKDK